MAVPDAPTNFTQTPGTGFVRLGWTEVAGATSYEVTSTPKTVLRSTTGTQLDVRFADLDVGTAYEFFVRANNDEGLSEPAAEKVEVSYAIPEPSDIWKIVSWATVGTGAALAVLFVVVGYTGSAAHDVIWRSAALASTALATILAVLTLADASRYGMFRSVIGFDGRISTSKTQFGLWTLLVAFVIIYFAGLRWWADRTGLFEGLSLNDATGTTGAWGDYLILLGGPIASLVLAKGITTAKVQNGTIQKSVAGDGHATLGQAFQDDSGRTDLVDTQYLIFNFVAFTFVVVALASENRLPEIPPLLLALTGTSAATYVINKATEQGAPVLRSIIPASASPGQAIVLEGQNFLPQGSTKAPAVSIGGKQATVVAPATDAKITVIVPLGLEAGVKEVELTTSATVTSETRQLDVRANQAQILGVAPTTVPATGARVLITGTGFTSFLATDKTTTSVKVGDVPQTVPVTQLPSGLDQVGVQIPATAAGTTVALVVQPPLATASAAVTISVMN